MSLDQSRRTFNPVNNFSGVLMQQGRVQLDSDWNEWLAELNRRQQAGTLDLIGQAAVPATTPNAFQITLSGGYSSLSFEIGPGRMYVDGLLAECHGQPVPPATGWTPAAAATTVVPGLAWDPALAELIGASPVPYSQQPYLARPTPLPVDSPFLVYLDVWQREVDAILYPDLIEKAVGVDTTGRLQTVWQVKFLPLTGANAGVTCTTPPANIPAWQALLLPPGLQLTTGIVQSAQSGPCSLSANSGYTGLENQLYRVEIHQPGTPGTATFKWSRDNACVETSVLTLSPTGTSLTVQSTGKDDLLRFSQGDWVEVLNDDLTLAGTPGQLCRIVSVVDATSTITLETALSSTLYPAANSIPNKPMRLRRWDTANPVYVANTQTVYHDGSTGDIPVPADGSVLVLENGVTISFSQIATAAPASTGQFWNFATRTADSTVEALVQAPPRGIHHHYARLAVVNLVGSPPTASDCRTAWPPTCSSGCCDCTVNVSPTDAPNLQSILDNYQNQTSTTTFCFAAGNYVLSAPLHLSANHNNFVLEPCSGAAVSFGTAATTDPAFSDGMLVIAGSSSITVDSITFNTAAGPLGSPNFAGLPITAYDTGLAATLNPLYTSFGIRLVAVTAVTVQGCTFTYGAIPYVHYIKHGIVVAAGIFCTGACTGLVIAGNSFTGLNLFSSGGFGFLQVPNVIFQPLSAKPAAAPLTVTTMSGDAPVEVNPTHLNPAFTEVNAGLKATPSVAAPSIAPATLAKGVIFDSAPKELSLNAATLVDKDVQQAGLERMKEDEAAAATQDWNKVSVASLGNLATFGGRVNPNTPATHPAAISSASQVTPATLDRTVFRDNVFSNVSWPITLFGQNRAVNILRNTMYRVQGVWSVSPQRFSELISQVPASMNMAALAFGVPLPAGASPATVAVPAPPATIRVFAGLNNYTDSQGNPWTLDANTPNVTILGAGLAPIIDNVIQNAQPAQSDQALYRSQRRGPSVTYTFNNLPLGFYKLAYKFIERDDTQPGMGLINIAVNTYVVYPRFDIFAAAGALYSALDFTTPAIEPSGQTITLSLTPDPSSKDQNTNICAVSVTPQWSDPGPSGSSDPTIQLNSFLTALVTTAQQGYTGEYRPGYSSPASLSFTLRVEDNELVGGTLPLLVLGDDFANTTGLTGSVICRGNRISGTGFLYGSPAPPMPTYSPVPALPIAATKFSSVALISRVFRVTVNDNQIINGSGTLDGTQNSLVIDSDAYAPPYAPATFLPQVMVSGNILQGQLNVSPPRTTYLADLGGVFESYNLLNSFYPPSQNANYKP